MYRGLLRSEESESKSIAVAIKEMQSNGPVDSFYEFQHEVAIMRYFSPSLFIQSSNLLNSKLQHENLVRLFGVTKSLKMVLEFVPESDLHQLLQKTKAVELSPKWRLKVAIDCASGLKYVLFLLFLFL